MTDLLDDDRPFDDPVFARVRAARPAVEPLDASERARMRAAIDTVPEAAAVPAHRRWRAVAWVAAAAVLVAAVAIGLHVRGRAGVTTGVGEDGWRTPTLAELMGHTYRWTEATEDGVRLALDPAFTVSFGADPDGKPYIGAVTCNGGSGPATIDDGGRVAVGEYMQHEIWCGGARAAAESFWLSLLDDRPQIAVRGVELRLQTPTRALSATSLDAPIESAASTVTDDQLAGHNYSTSRFVVDGVERSIAFAQPSFTFTATPDGLQLIAGACLRGTMRVVDGRLTGSVARNPRGCAADFYQLDDHLMAMLNASPSISLDGASLVIDSGTARVEATQYEPTDVMPLGFLGTLWRYSSEVLPSVPQAGSPPTLQISAEGTWLFGPCSGPGGKVVGRVDGTIAMKIGDVAPVAGPAGGCVLFGEDAALADKIRSIGGALDGGDAVATRVGDTLVVTTAASRLEFTLLVPGKG